MTRSATYQKLTELLSRENIIKTIKSYDNKISYQPINHSDKTVWYAKSYPVILKGFARTRGLSDETIWVERIALISSWLPTIPNPNLNKEAIQDMMYLEGIFNEVKLETIGIESYLGEMNTVHHGEIIFDTAENRPPVLIKSFLETADRVTNLSGRWHGTLSTTTKLLHFMCPHLFPIFDKKISSILFNGKQNYINYHNYIFALHEFLHNADETVLLKKISEEKDISIIRTVDIILFNQLVN